MSQAKLRTSLRQIRQNITGQHRTNLSRDLTKSLASLSCLSEAKRIASFLSMPEEIDTQFLNAHFFALNASLFLPVVIQKGAALMFAPYEQDTEFVTDVLGMTIPDVDKERYVSGEGLDVCFVPLVGFDRSGNRIGMGGGFYDRTFAFLSKKRENEQYAKPLLIGVAYDEQYVASIARNYWDVKLDFLITPTSVYEFNEHV